MPGHDTFEAPVRLLKLGHRFHNQPWLFRGLDATFLAGRSYALIGPSGSGKSTLLSVIAGWETPAEGSVQCTADISIKWVFQNPHGVRNRSARDHVIFPYLTRGFTRAEATAQASEILTQVGLQHRAEQPFHTLSGGEAQRLLLARGIAAAPKVLLVDEPTAQLDYTTADTVNTALHTLQKQATTVIVATHDERTRNACDEHIDLTTLSDTHGEPLCD